MTQEKYVTSSAIESIRKEIEEDVIPRIRELHAMLGDTTVGFPGWGAVGELAVGMRYREVQRDVGEKFDDAVEVLESWTAALTTARVNWRTAEDNSTVVYQ
ncbi:hypothetical protein GCM10022252_25420 [Streptosporangium oxazolinicum]|uniref:WXG100 family type VII secretion target n=1 Tax=Streptosporangium oxazolinicum TaxID=909287 RepID=A0ABP8ARY4_9ACTN